MEYIKATNGNNLTNVIDWVLKQQTHVEEMINGYNIKLTEWKEVQVQKESICNKAVLILLCNINTALLH